MKGRDPIFKCSICGKWISYKDIMEDKIKKEFTPDSLFTSECTEMYHKKCAENESK